ncbi:sulfate transporter CysZ [Testudinibacter sp. P80/BLE/0925]|uniref:sulfate transporter CysZ n=1 Tax=Testudinibacter sp. TW-1 TaxID=3417757 RepID=UPI003D369632
MYQSEFKQGLEYFLRGWHLITQPGLRRFVIMPILINIVLLVLVFWVMLGQIGSLAAWTVSFVPAWLDWLGYIIYALAIVTVLLVFFFIFNLLAGFIAAPFNGILAEKVERMLTGQALDDMGMLDLAKDTPRILLREWQKFAYSFPKFIGLFILSFVPGIGQTLVPPLFFLYGAWMAAIQYGDYPFDNHKIPFKQMRYQLAEKRSLNLTFGGLVSICTFIPFLNFIIIPVAVCGATALWVEHYRVVSNADFRRTSGRTEVATRTPTDLIP